MNCKFLLIFLFAGLIYAQTETVKWNKTETDYSLETPAGKDYNIDRTGVSSFIFSSLQTSYYFLISEYDGDNCPFHPSCSHFFVDAVKETNIVQGALMFADRFTRDINFFKGFNSYPVDETGRFYDPACNYTLNYNDIIINSVRNSVDEKN